MLLVDRNNYHKFQPLLYQIATAGLTAADITRPVRDVLRRQDNARFCRATVTGIDPESRCLHTEHGYDIPYDLLILAVGAVTNYADVEGVKAHAFPLKNIPDALLLRNRLLACFEEADGRPELRVPGVLDVVIVGGGPTGVETAAMLAELYRETMRRDFEWVDRDTAQVHLLNRGEAVMAKYPPALREFARRSLVRRGVQVHLNTSVTAVTAKGVRTEDDAIEAGTVVWAAGVRAHPLAETVAEALDLSLEPGGRLPVTPALHLPDHPSIFVAGDLAGGRDDNGSLHPQLAPVAIQQGKHAARQIRRRLQGKEPEPFRYRNLGKMATLGRNAGIADLAGGMNLKGRLAWLIWAAVHIAKLPGMRNRLVAFLNWVYNYLTYDRKARLIVDMVPPDERAESGLRMIQEKLDGVAGSGAPDRNP